MQHEFKALPLGDFEVVDDERGVVEAIVSVTGVWDEVDDLIEPGAYQKTLARRVPKCVMAHQWTEPIGKTLEAKELMPGDPGLPTFTANGKPWPKEAGALKVRAQFNLDTQRGREAYSDVKFFGAEAAWSVGYQVPVGKATIEQKGAGKTGRRIQEMDLYEFSPVLHGAMPLAMTTSVKTAQSALIAVKTAMAAAEEKDVSTSSAPPKTTRGLGTSERVGDNPHKFKFDPDSPGKCDVCGKSRAAHQATKADLAAAGLEAKDVSLDDDIDDGEDRYATREALLQMVADEELDDVALQELGFDADGVKALHDAAGLLVEEKAVRRVRTPEGARKYGVPIGTAITPDVVPNVVEAVVERAVLGNYDDDRIRQEVTDALSEANVPERDRRIAAIDAVGRVRAERENPPTGDMSTRRPLIGRELDQMAEAVRGNLESAADPEAFRAYVAENYPEVLRKIESDDLPDDDDDDLDAANMARQQAILDALEADNLRPGWDDPNAPSGDYDRLMSLQEAANVVTDAYQERAAAHEAVDAGDLSDEDKAQVHTMVDEHFDDLDDLEGQENWPEVTAVMDALEAGHNAEPLVMALNQEDFEALLSQYPKGSLEARRIHEWRTGEDIDPDDPQAPGGLNPPSGGDGVEERLFTYIDRVDLEMADKHGEDYAERMDSDSAMLEEFDQSVLDAIDDDLANGDMTDAEYDELLAAFEETRRTGPNPPSGGGEGLFASPEEARYAITRSQTARALLEDIPDRPGARLARSTGARAREMLDDLWRTLPESTEKDELGKIVDDLDDVLPQSGGVSLDDLMDILDDLQLWGMGVESRHIGLKAYQAVLDTAYVVDVETKVSSRSMPSLDRKPGKSNWVDEAGGLPSYIERIAKHLHYEKGMTIGHAIATAVNQVKKWAAGTGDVSAKTRAKAAKAVAEWEAKKAKAKLKRDEKDALTVDTENADAVIEALQAKLGRPIAEGRADRLRTAIKGLNAALAEAAMEDGLDADDIADLLAQQDALRDALGDL